jgi:hypothetical protein
VRETPSRDIDGPARDEALARRMNGERVVREALRRSLVETQKGPTKTVDEFWVPRTHERADLAIIGRTMQAFEIKSEHDTLRRLPRQADAYGRVFDRCTAVLADRHREGALAILPVWWGVTTVSVNGHVVFEEVRRPRPNPCIDPEILVRLLWREEVRAALAALGQSPVDTATRSAMWHALLEAVEVKGLRRIVRRALLARSGATARIPSRQFRQQSANGEARR